VEWKKLNEYYGTNHKLEMKNYYELDEVIDRGNECLIAHYGEEMRKLIEENL
jgi:hypothetical protein